METTVNKYLVCLGNEGYEALLNLTDIQEEEVMSKLRGVETKRSNEFNHFLATMPLRIRFNSHRNIKAYVVETEVDEKEFVDLLCNSNELCKSIQEKHTPLERF